MGILTVPAEEATRRAAAVRAVIHSGNLEGFPDDLVWEVEMWRFTRGEIDYDELQRRAHNFERHEGGSPPAPTNPSSSMQ